MKKYLIIIALVVGCMLTAKAQVVQTMNLKNGSILHGYMKSQKSGGSIVFSAENADIVIDGKKVKNVSGKKVAFNNLPDEWKTYAEANELLDKKR